MGNHGGSYVSKIKSDVENLLLVVVFFGAIKSALSKKTIPALATCRQENVMGQQAQPITQPATNPFQGAAQAMQVAGGTLGNIAQGGAYPATQDFIQRTQDNMMRQQQMQQNQLDAQA